MYKTIGRLAGSKVHLAGHDYKPEDAAKFDEALRYLISNGFIVEVIAAYSKSERDEIISHLYTLDVKDPLRICQLEKHETILSAMDAALATLGIKSDRNDNRHYKSYLFVTEPDVSPKVRGDVKPVYLPVNPKNTPFENALNQKIKNHRNYKIWLKSILSQDEDEVAVLFYKCFNDMENAVIS
ncbi:MAG: hypothetical protein PHN84_15960 [Desulfuromonadaceae bacterium]|nr:hypothetical protein [Desulfuromonadaceae bacterium]